MVFEKLVERIIIRGEIITQTPLHIGSGKKDIEIGDIDTPIIVDTSDQPYIPGSSLKGKVRAEAERIARQNNEPIPVCNPPNINNMCGTLKKTPENFCICCKIFGTAARSDGTSVASKVRFRDSYPLTKVETLLTRTGTALDRSTTSVSSGSLYTTEAVPAGTRFGLEIVGENLSERELNLVRAALKSVRDSGLGGYSSRGFGKVKFKIDKIVKRNPKYYLGEEQEKEVAGTELESWKKALEE
jgi:CRISPR-associated RAMP protein (TIGR02581 family)